MTRDKIEAVFEGLNPGDEIEVTFRRRVLKSDRTRLTTEEPDGECRIWRPGELDYWQGSIEVISRAIPPEPPEGSVVLDREGFVWQMMYGKLCSVYSQRRSWRELHDLYSPLRVIYTPGEAS